jgi:hypothetical protein
VLLASSQVPVWSGRAEDERGLLGDKTPGERSSGPTGVPATETAWTRSNADLGVPDETAGQTGTESVEVSQRFTLNATTSSAIAVTAPYTKYILIKIIFSLN